MPPPTPFTEPRPLAVFDRALAIARARARGSGRELFAGGRDACWVCHRIRGPCEAVLTAIGPPGGSDDPCAIPLCVVGTAAGIVATALWLPFCAARRHESDSYAMVVTESLIVQVEDFVGCACPPFDEDEEARSIIVVRSGDVALARSVSGCCDARVEVFLKDPGTGAAKVIKGNCCCPESEAPPDHVWQCVHEPERLAATLRDASSAATASRSVAGSGGVGGGGSNGGGVSRDMALAVMRSAARSGAAKPTQAQADLFSL